MANIDLNTLAYPQGIKIQGAASTDHSGNSISSVGDVNGDGYADFLIGARDADPLGRGGAGTSYLIFGKTGWIDIDLNALTVPQGIKIQGAASGDESGGSVSSAGDVNDDGYADFLIGAYKADPLGRSEAGTSYIIFGKNTGFTDIDLNTLTLPQGIKIQGAANNDESGRSVSSAGDVNGDGYADFLIGTILADPLGRLSAGESYLIFGNSTLADIDLKYLNITQGIKIQGAAQYDYSSYSISGAGDVNGDGHDDFLIGAVDADPGYNRAGESYLIFGKNTGWQDVDLNTLSPSQGIKIQGAAYKDLSGYSVSGAGDVNGDGYDDFLIGAILADPLGRDGAGTSYLIFGTSTPTSSHSAAPTGAPSFNPTKLPSAPTDLPSALTTSLPTSPSFTPTLTPIAPILLAEEDPFYQQEWFWIATVSICINAAILLIVIHQRFKKQDVNNEATQSVIVSPTPIGITLDTNREIELVKLDGSSVKFNYNGTSVKTSWVGSNDAILVYDYNENKIVDDASEIVLTKWSKNSKTDFEALLEVFDSNKDNIFNDQDNEFDKFYIWQDKNQNGISDEGELTSLLDAGIKYIDFNTQSETTEAMKSLGILHTAEVHWESGLVTQAYDLVFEHEIF